MYQFHFTFENIKTQYQKALNLGYEVITCEKYCDLKKNNVVPDKCIVNRVDIDLSVRKAERLVDLFDELDVKASFFLRLHAPEYNPFSFENYRIIKKLIESGHELGYHSEIIDQSVIWNEDAEECFKRDIDIINRLFNVKVAGSSSHGGMTGLNNLEFWKDIKPSDFGLLYEAYDTQSGFNLFSNSFYISDSEWTRWKCYNKGKLVEGNRRSFAEHASDNHKLIYLLIHSDTYFDRHFYE